MVAISGGGAYAAHLIAQVPLRITSVHLAAATSGGSLANGSAAADLLADVEAIARDPAAFWHYPPESAVHLIPGFIDAAREEGLRALGDPARATAALRHELALLRSAELPDLHALEAPVFLYWGTNDELVPLEHAAAWRASFGRIAAMRTYPREGHDVQYLHWREIMRDIAGAMR